MPSKQPDSLPASHAVLSWDTMQLRAITSVCRQILAVAAVGAGRAVQGQRRRCDNGPGRSVRGTLRFRSLEMLSNSGPARCDACARHLALPWVW